MISVLIGVVVGAICFWAIDKFAPDRRLANLLKLLVVLVLPRRYFATSSAADILANARLVELGLRAKKL
jgi:hypothetical protein